MQEFFNDYVQSLETYIMFRIKETVARITPELIAKDRAPISLSMGAPTATPPQALIDALKNALDEKGVHLYSTPSVPAATLKMAVGSVNPCSFSKASGPSPSSLRMTNFRGLPSAVIHTSCVRLASSGVIRASSSRRINPQFPW